VIASKNDITAFACRDERGGRERERDEGEREVREREEKTHLINSFGKRDESSNVRGAGAVLLQRCLQGLQLFVDGIPASKIDSPSSRDVLDLRTVRSRERNRIRRGTCDDKGRILSSSSRTRQVLQSPNDKMNLSLNLGVTS
jgi:hypothetical protein